MTAISGSLQSALVPQVHSERVAPSRQEKSCPTSQAWTSCSHRSLFPAPTAWFWSGLHQHWLASSGIWSNLMYHGHRMIWKVTDSLCNSLRIIRLARTGQHWSTMAAGSDWVWIFSILYRFGDYGDILSYIVRLRILCKGASGGLICNTVLSN